MQRKAQIQGLYSTGPQQNQQQQQNQDAAGNQLPNLPPDSANAGIRATVLITRINVMRRTADTQASQIKAGISNIERLENTLYSAKTRYVADYQEYVKQYAAYQQLDDDYKAEYAKLAAQYQQAIKAQTPASATSKPPARTPPAAASSSTPAGFGSASTGEKGATPQASMDYYTNKTPKSSTNSLKRLAQTTDSSTNTPTPPAVNSPSTTQGGSTAQEIQQQGDALTKKFQQNKQNLAAYLQQLNEKNKQSIQDIAAYQQQYNTAFQQLAGMVQSSQGLYQNIEQLLTQIESIGGDQDTSGGLF